LQKRIKYLGIHHKINLDMDDTNIILVNRKGK